MSDNRSKSTAQWKGFDNINLAKDEDGCLIPMYGPAAVLSHEAAVDYLIRALNVFKSRYTPEQITEINKDEHDFYFNEGEYLGKRVLPTTIARSGFIYLLKAEGGYYKIGKTINLEDRLLQYKTLPWTVHLVDSFFAQDMREAEIALHQMFADVRLKGEWFNLTSEHLKLFRSYYADS